LDTFAKRQPLSVADYEKLFYEEAQLDDTGSTQFADYQTGAFRLTEISEHQRIYKGN
ncbi:MAG: hydroxymethylglutaryl-CoA synthase, partial [Streptococcus salivarius]